MNIRPFDSFHLLQTLVGTVWTVLKYILASTRFIFSLLMIVVTISSSLSHFRCLQRNLI